MTNNHENRTQRLGRREFLKKDSIWGDARTAAFAVGRSAGSDEIRKAWTMKRMAVAVALMLGAAGFVAGSAGAGTYLNTIGDEALLSGAGHRLEATLIIGCTAGEHVRLRLTVTQGGTVGVGHAAGRCSGDVQHYPVTVAGTEGDVFTEGPAEAEAWAETSHGQHTHTPHTWDKTIFVVDR